MQRKTYYILLALIVGLLALRLVHIRADFPAYHFYSQDGARYSDEGFYTGAAIHHFTLGHAYTVGGWNPGVFMPVWPLMVGLVFHFTGVSVAAARSLAVLCTWLSVLLAYAIARQYRSRAFAYVTAFLFAANALGFFFGRLALLEPAFVMYLLLAIYLAGRVRPGTYALAIAVGVVFTVATLTKTTGPFVLPAILYPIWARNRTIERASNQPAGSAAWKPVVTTLMTAVLLMGCIKLLWFHRFAADAQIILGMDPIWQLRNSPPRLLRFFLRGTWVDPVLFPLAVAAFVAASTKLRFLWRDTLFTTAFLWETGYAAFIVFHYDGPPRYFVSLIVPTIWLATIFAEWIWRNHRPAGIAVAAAIAVSVAWNIVFIGNYMLHPRYALVDASIGIAQLIDAQHPAVPQPRPLLIGRAADEVSLLSGGLPTIDTDGSMLLADKLEFYRPGWFMNWTDDSLLRPATVAASRRMVERAEFPALNPYNGAGIVVYQIFPREQR